MTGLGIAIIGLILAVCGLALAVMAAIGTDLSEESATDLLRTSRRGRILLRVIAGSFFVIPIGLIWWVFETFFG